MSGPLAAQVLESTSSNTKLLLQHYVGTLLKAIEGYLAVLDTNIGELDNLVIALFCDFTVKNHLAMLFPTVKSIYQHLSRVNEQAPESAGFQTARDYLRLIEAITAASASSGTTPSANGDGSIVVGNPAAPTVTVVAPQVMAMAASLPAREKCPACGTNVSFDAPWTAVCGRGHTWDRCSITFLIVSNPLTRACVGCNRKALVAEASGLDVNTAPLTNAILDLATQCMYCGNRMRQPDKTFFEGDAQEDA
ncbi:hypothetical protein HK102_001402 [Quaeritorhiza haematococci]|nr:hypothetical protein HK102_001402 [Quaeritorhiza haematococci]